MMNPVTLFEDPAPCVSTSAAAISLQQANQLDKVMIPCNIDELANQPFWLENFVIPKNSESQTVVYSKDYKELNCNIAGETHDDLDVLSATWNDIRNCHYSYGVPTFKFIFRHIGSSEVKGKIRIDYYNYLVPSPTTYDQSRLRNAHVYWQLEDSDSCSFEITPIANSYTIKRTFQINQTQRVNSEPDAVVSNANTTTRSDTAYLQPDAGHYAAFQVVLDEALNYPSIFPNSLLFHVFLQISYNGTFMKSYQEPIRGGIIPPYS